MNRYSPEYRLAERIVHLEDALDYANKMLTEHNMFGVLPSSSIEFTKASRFHKRVRTVLEKNNGQ